MADKRKNAGSRNKGKKRRSTFGYYRKSAMLIICVLVLLSGVLGVSAVGLVKKNTSLKEQQVEIQEQIDAENARTEEIEELKEYSETDEFEKEIAEEKLGLVDPNEIVFTAVD